MSHELYISDWCRKAGCTPENDYDPRYYDAGGSLSLKDLCYIGKEFGYDSFFISFDNVLYTENINVMRYMQDDAHTLPMWFGVCGDDVNIVDKLHKFGWTW